MLLPPPAAEDEPSSEWWTGWPVHIAANIGVGVAAGAAWPLIYIMGYVIAGQAGWVVGDPTLTDDGVGIPIGLGVIVIAVIAGVFAALNIPIARRARIPGYQWIPTAVAVSMLSAMVTASQFYYR